MSPKQPGTVWWIRKEGKKRGGSGEPKKEEVKARNLDIRYYAGDNTTKTRPSCYEIRHEGVIMRTRK